MAYCTTNKFAKYKVNPETEKSAKVWDNAELYKTSYFKMSEKNVNKLFKV